MNDVFKAIADPTRRKILLLLAESPENVNAISERFNISRPAISKHIKLLTNSNLVKIRPDSFDGRQRICHLQINALKEVNDYLDQLQQFWDAKLDGLSQYLDKSE